ncbi:hypothetical protein AbraIFM66950_000739, partial [Aspergillus brasiliensis]
MPSLASLTAIAILIPLAVSNQSSNPNVTSTLKISPAATPLPGKQIVDAAYQSFSIEFSFMADYAGNDTHPNLFSRQVIQNLYDISGAYPIFRVGGSTQSSAIYYPNQTEAIIDPFDSVASDQPSHTFVGPSWFQSFRQFPNGTQYIYGLNFFNTVNETYDNIGNGLGQCVLEANAAYETMGDSLYAYEIGNEVDGWGNGKHREGNWTVQRYVNQWNEFATAISRNLTGKDAARLFQGCAFEAPRHVNERTDWNVENAELDGMGPDKAKTVSDHEYMGANCHYTGAGPTIADTLFDRTNMLSRVWYHDYLGNATATSGIKYVIGETNSISCQGAFNISDVMASAVWAVDYVMYLSSLKVSRVHFHMGTRYRYSPWQPIFYNDSGNKQTEVLVNETNFGAYAVYSSGSLDSIVAVNLNIWNSTFDPVARPYTALALPDDWQDAKVSRLTSPGVDIAGNITFSGQYVDGNGRIVGKKTYDKVNGGEVLVGAGEA